LNQSPLLRTHGIFAVKKSAKPTILMILS